MRQLLPTTTAVENVLDLLADDTRPAPGDRPWVMANMVSSVDGAYALDGRSAPLSGPADREVFHALRALADVVLAAAGTARAEHYRRPAPEPGAASLRNARGQAPAARLVLISSSLEIPTDQPFLSGDGPAPLIIHPPTADASALPAGVEARPVASGYTEDSTGAGDRVDPRQALALLADEGVGLVLCEGGPSLLGQLAEADVVDELFLTVSPLLAGGGRTGILGGAAEIRHGLVLHRVMEDEGFLLLTYRRDRR